MIRQWDIFKETREVLTEMGGKGSGHRGHKGGYGGKGNPGGSKPSKGRGLALRNFSRHVIGGGKGKSRKRVIVKAQYGNTTVKAMANLEDEKYLPTPDQMHNYLSNSRLFMDTTVDNITFVPEDRFGDEKYGGSYLLGSANVVTRDLWTKRRPRSTENIVTTLDHELAHHLVKGDKRVDLGKLEGIAAAERGEFYALSGKAHIDALWDTNRNEALNEYFAYSTEMYFHDRANLSETSPQTAKYMEGFYER